MGGLQTVHGTRLKNKLITRIPDLSAHVNKHSKGHGILLMFDDDVAHLVHEASLREDYDMDAVHLAEAAYVVRASMFEQKSSFVFDGSFQRKCQEQDILKPLKALVDMILQGPSIKSRSEMSNTIQPALTIAQLILFNSVKHARDGLCSGKIRHRCDSPLPLYIGMKVHAVTRKKGLVNMLF